MATQQGKKKGIGGELIGIGSDIVSFIEEIVGSDVLDMGMDWWKSEQGRKQIDEWNAKQRELNDKRNELVKQWNKETRGYDTSVDGDRSGYFYTPAKVVPMADGTFGVDTNNDGTAERTFTSRDAAEAYVGEIGGTTSFETYGGEGLYSREVEDVVIENQNQIRKVVQQLQSPEDRKKLLDAIAKFADLQSDRTSKFITSAMIDEDIMEDDEVVVESLSKARTELINNLNTILKDTAAAVNLADAIGTGEINRADFNRAIDVGDALKDQAGDVSDQEYYRAMAVVAANEDKYDLLLAASREAQLDIHNKLQAERYQSGFEGMSTRHTRDLAREFLANNTSLAKQLADINIQNSKILGDAHVRRANLTGEANVKAEQLEGDASVRGAERTRQSEMKQADRTGQAAASAEENLIKNKDYFTNLRDRLKFEGYKQELYEMDRIGERDKALSSGVLEEQKMLQPYRMGEEDYGNPTVAKQMFAPEFDWLGNLLGKILDTNRSGGDSSGLLGSLLDGIKSGFAGIATGIAGMFGGDDETDETGVVYKTQDDGTLKGSNGKTIDLSTSGGGNLGNENQSSTKTPDGSGTVLNPVLPPGSILDDDGNGVDDRTDMNGDGVINNEDTLYYEPESGKYFNIDPVTGGRNYLDGSEQGSFDGDGVDLSTSVPGTKGLDTDGDGVIDSYSIDGINDEGFFQSDEDKINQNIETEVGDFVDDLYSDVDGDSVHGGELTDGTNQNVGDNTLGDKSAIGYQLGAEQQLGGVGVVYNPETGMFEVTDANGATTEFTFDEMNEFGIAIPESEIALYEAKTHDFQMTDGQLGLDTVGGSNIANIDLGLGDFSLDDEFNLSSSSFDDALQTGGQQATLSGGGAAGQLASVGGGSGILNDISNIGTGVLNEEVDMGYGIDPTTGRAYTHEDYMAGNTDPLRQAVGGDLFGDLPSFELDFDEFNFPE